MKIFKAVIFLIYGFYSLMSNAEEECPLTLPSTVQKLNTEIPGWTVTDTDDKHVLVEVAIFDGPAEEQHGVVPEGEQRFKKNGKDFLSIYWNLEQPQGIQYWIRCGYSGTKVALTRKIVGSKVRCEATNSVFNGVVAPIISSAKCEPR